MPRFKPYDYRQSLLVPLTLEEQLPAGSLEYALHHLIEERIEESWFEDLYANEEMSPSSPPRKAPNHALLRTAPCVTAPASTAAFPPTMQVPRRTPLSLSLRLSLIHI